MGKRLLSFLVVCLCAVSMAFAQQKITGKVIDHETGEPIVGASVIVNGANGLGAATDLNGHFTIQNVPSSAKTVRVSYIGMKTADFAIRSNMNITLQSEATGLNDVMVVAYGTQSKASFTGSASTIKADALEDLHVSTVSQALAGAAPGIQIASASGTPGSEASIRIRGIGSISASQEPLIVLDGVPYEGDLGSIPTQDIESLTVLKDAAANSMYGARGANGVILVTTKSGKVGKTKIDFEASWGINTKGVSYYDIVSDPGEFYELTYESYRNSLVDEMGYTQASIYAANNLISDILHYNIYKGVADNEVIDPMTGKLNTACKTRKWGDDWTKDVFENGLRQEYKVGISGGTEATKAYASLGYLKDEGYAPGSGYDRYNGRIKVDHKLGKYITVGGSIGYSRTDKETFGTEGNNYSNIFSFVQSIAPIYPIYLYKEDGSLWLDEKGKRQYDWGSQYTRPYGSEQNPYAAAKEGINKYSVDNVTARGYFTATFLKDFKFTANLGYDVQNSWGSWFDTPIGGDALNVNGRGEKENWRTDGLDAQEILDWTHTFNDLHTLGFKAGHENQKMGYKQIYGHMTNFADPTNPEFSNAALYQDLTSKSYEIARDAYFLQGNYSYADRYYLNASIRRDGSSIFHKDNRWGTFWAVGASWRLKEEAWLKDVDWLDNLKIKASYGIQGNDNINVSRAYTDLYQVDRIDGAIGLTKYRRGNKDLTWEKSRNLNVGVEAGFFDRLNVGLDFFVKVSKDMLYPSPLATSEGAPSTIWKNEMDMKNTGIEFFADGDIIRTKDLVWSANFNFTHYKNKLTKLPASKPASEYPDGYQAGQYWRKIGGSLYDFYMYEYAGVDKETGRAMYYTDVTNYYDADGNAISAAEASKLGEGNYTEKVEKETVIGISNATQYQTGKSAIPDLVGGIGTTVKYKGFDLSIQTAFQIGGYVYDGGYSSLMHAGGEGKNYHKDLFNRWTPNNTNTDIPRLFYNGNDEGISGNSDYYLTKASYFSLRNITLGYTIPKNLLSKIGVDKIRVYVSGDNIWLHSKRKGLDPRFSFSGIQTDSYGDQVYGGSYSAIATYTLGFNLTF